MKHSMDYLSLIQSILAYKIASTEGGQFYTYGTFVMEAYRTRSPSPGPAAPFVAWVKVASAHGQLVRFLTFSGTSRVPVVVPADMKYVPESLIIEEIPAGACMGVPTSGPTGQPKLRFRTLDSWASLFSIQDTIFGMITQTQLFTQGNLAFIGNLNPYLSLPSLGASIIATSHVNPSVWCREIRFHHVGVLYLIPSRLRLLAKYASHPNPDTRTIPAGS